MKKKRDKKEITKMVNDVIMKSARKEAIYILENCDDKWFKDFKDHYKKGVKEEKKSGYSSAWNICCLSLDFGKYYMVKEGIVKQKKKDHFGGYIEEILKSE